MNSQFTLQIPLPTDEGFIGRKCGSNNCGKYFKIHLDAIDDNMYCPYCGQKFVREDLLTTEQLAYLKRIGEEQAKKVAFDLMDNFMRDWANKTKGSRFIKVTHRPINYRPRHIEPTYTEQKVDSEISCSKCGLRFQVYGIFGHCPGCGSENIAIYDINLEIIKRRIESGETREGDLRHAYMDLVSTFESICRARTPKDMLDQVNFREWNKARKFFKEQLSIDIFADFYPKELLVVRRVFQKRNAYEHHRGMIEERYITKIPEDKLLLGQKAELSLEEFLEAARILRVVLTKLIPQ